MSRFEEFWKLYPKKVGKKPCHDTWKRKKLDEKAEMIIADVERRQRLDRKWLEGFIVNPQTYLNQERWEDEITYASKQPQRQAAELDPGPQLDRFERAMNRLLLQYLRRRRGVPGEAVPHLVAEKNRLTEDLRLLVLDGEDVSEFHAAAVGHFDRVLSQELA